MIKIVKPGQKEFKGYCDRCGCEFTYEFEDIVAGSVECPTCGHAYYHPSKGLTPPSTGWPWPNIGEPIPCNTPSDTALNPCVTCDWWKKMQQPGFTYVGDIPCTWCNKGPYKVTCGTTTATVKINDNTSASTSLSYSGPYTNNIYSTCSGDCQHNTISVDEQTPPQPPKSGSNVVKGCNSCQNDSKCSGNKSCKEKH
jgi:hypothetical protein